MKNTPWQRIRSAVGILTTVSIFAAALCLMAGCIALYRADSFTPDAVAAAFARIRIPVYLCLALVVGGLLFDRFAPCPAPAKKRRAPASPCPAPKPGVLTVILLVLGLAALVVGYVTGGTADVLTKAVNICTECVGLG